MTKFATVIERIKTTPGLFRDSVALMICGVMALACGGYILSHQDYHLPGYDDFMFAAEFDKAPAVRPESMQEVRIAGLEVGRISGAEPTKDGTAKLEFTIDADQVVYENARVLLRTKSPLNVMYATLDPGGPPAAPLAEGATIPMSQTGRIIQTNELLDKLDERARMGLTSLLNELDVALAEDPQNLGKGLVSTENAMKSFQPVLAELETRRDNIKQLVTSFSYIAEAAGKDDDRLAELVTASQLALGALANRDSELAESLKILPGFSKELKESMSSVDLLTSQLDPTLDNLVKASDELPGAVEDLTGSVAAIRKFVNGAAPVVDKAVPILRDLRPFVPHARNALTTLKPATGYLPDATRKIVPWMEDLAAFVYQTSSSFSLFDANGGLGRANLNLDLTNPTGGLQDEGIKKEGN